MKKNFVLLFMLLIVVILVSGCIKYKFEKENETVREDYDIEKDLALLEEAKQKREKIEGLSEETTVELPETPSENGCKEVLEDLKRTVTESTNCMYHADCGLVNIPLGCVGSYLPVNREAVKSTVPLLKYLSENCEVRVCEYPKEEFKYGCVNNECVAYKKKD